MPFEVYMQTIRIT